MPRARIWNSGRSVSLVNNVESRSSEEVIVLASSAVDRRLSAGLISSLAIQRFRAIPRFSSIVKLYGNNMSVRRKSCDACFQARRKCDLTYPICKRCRKNQKTCHYVRTPTTSEEDTPQAADEAFDQSLDVTSFIDWTVTSPGQLQRGRNDTPAFNFNLQGSSLLDDLLSPTIPNFLGNLGDIQPISGNTQSWEWVIDQLKSYPREFAEHAELPFIHKDLFRDQPPHAIRSVFGICAAYRCMNDANKNIMFQTLNEEVVELLSPALGATLLEALSRLQALVLYQIIRLFDDDLKQRTIAEQQQSLTGAWALQLLQRSNVELQGEQPTRENFILAESIRRTVMVAFLLYAVYSIFKYGVCPEFATLSILPVSTKAALWNSPPAFLEQCDLSETMKYPDFTELWLASPKKNLDPFKKLILVACKGIEQVEALSPSETAA
jgi:hypothetical protein